MRKQIWDYLEHRYPQLIHLARRVALYGAPQAAQRKKCQACTSNACPQPINYLVNGEDPSRSPRGLAGKLPSGYQLFGSGQCLSGTQPQTPVFNGCNFDVLQALASAKHGSLVTSTTDGLCGFGLGGSSGLSILLGPWTDYCLWCWSKHPDLGNNRDPLLIFGKDNSCFADEAIDQSMDWGEDQVRNTAKIRGASDPSTKNLFGTIEDEATKCNRTVEEFIADRRVFICNVWPWFRCGQISKGDDGVHDDFSEISEVRDFALELVDKLKPGTIAALGAWSWTGYRNRSQASTGWLQNKLLAGSKHTVKHLEILYHCKRRMKSAAGGGRKVRRLIGFRIPAHKESMIGSQGVHSTATGTVGTGA